MQVGDTVDSSLQSTADRSLAPFTGMSLRSVRLKILRQLATQSILTKGSYFRFPFHVQQTDSTTISALFDSNTTVSEMKSSRGVMDVF